MVFSRSEISIRKLRQRRAVAIWRAIGWRLAMVVCLFHFSVCHGVAASPKDWSECKSEDLDTIIPACRRILEDAGTSDADRIEAYRLRAAAYLTQHSFVSAGRDFGSIIKLDPRNIAALGGRAITSFRRGDRDQAVMDYSIAKRLDPRKLDAMVAASDDLKEVANFAAQSPPSQSQLDAALDLLKPTCQVGSRLDGFTCVPIICSMGQRLDGNNCGQIVCSTGLVLQGSTCVPINCPMGQRLDGNNCVQIVCRSGFQLDGSTCVPINCPAGQRLVANNCVLSPNSSSLLHVISESRWCTLKRSYHLAIRADAIVWEDSFGSIDIERIVSNDVRSAQTITQKSVHSGGDGAPQGTSWYYNSSGQNTISVSKNGGKAFFLTRC